MSGDGVVISVSPGVLEPKSSAMIKATTRTNSLWSNEKISSRYLRPPIGSCHDLCKYGHKHDYEDKKKHPIFLRFLANNQMPDGEYKSNLMIVQHRRQRSELKPRTNHTKYEPTDKTELNEQMDLPAERIIRISKSFTNRVAGSVYESSSLKLNAALCDQDQETSEGLMGIASDEHDSAKPSRGLFHESATMKAVRTTTQNDATNNKHVSITQVGGSLEEPVSKQFVVSSIIEETFTPEYKTVNPLEGSPVEYRSMDVISAPPITDNAASTEFQTANGAKESSNTLIGMKIKTLPGSSEGPSCLKLMNHKSKGSAKCRPANQAEVAPKEALGMKLKNPSSIQRSKSNMKTSIDQEGFSEAQIKVKSSCIGDKTKRELNKLNSRNEETRVCDRHEVLELNKLKNGNEETGVCDRREVLKLNKLKNGNEETRVSDSCEVAKQEQKSSSNGEFLKENSASRKMMKSVNLETEQVRSSCFQSVLACVRPRITKKANLSPSKTIDASSKTATSLQLKKVLVKSSSSPSISLTEVCGQMSQEEIIRVADNLTGGKEEVFEQQSTLPSTKPQLTGVSSVKLRKNRKVISSFTVNNQAKAGNFGLKQKTSDASEHSLEKVDLKNSRQKLRKHKSYSDWKGEHEESISQLSGASEAVLRRGVSQRTYRDVPKNEMKSRLGRISSLNSEDKIGTPLKLNFSRGKVINLQSESNSSPKRLRLRRVNVVGDNQKVKEIRMKSFRRNRRGPYGGESSTSLAKAIKVLLRHQDVDDKKDPQGLLNHVIEETASKLAESRKSKVKALVGAFETVISLQETKVTAIAALV